MSQVKMNPYQSQVREKQVELNKLAAQRILLQLHNSITARTVSTIQISSARKPNFV